MRQEVDPKNTNRAQAFELWMSSPMPMVTLTKTLDVSRLVRLSRRYRLKFNMLLCYCIGQAATQVQEFYLLPQKDKMYRYDRIALNVIVENRQGGINSCDIPFSHPLQQFNADYLRLTQQAAETCQSSFLDDYMIVGTSTLVQTQLDSIVNQYTDLFVNPFLAWGRYSRHLCRTTLPVSFQFHHVQMDGMQGARFLQQLQHTINSLSTCNLKPND